MTDQHLQALMHDDTEPSVRLEAYRQHKGFPRVAMARILGASYLSWRRWARYRRGEKIPGAGPPSGSFRLAIQRETGIPPEHWEAPGDRLTRLGRRFKADVGRQEVIDALAQASTIPAAAKLLNVGPATCWELTREHGIETNHPGRPRRAARLLAAEGHPGRGGVDGPVVATPREAAETAPRSRGAL